MISNFQIANYGLGGLYVPHTDHLMNNPNPEVYTAWERFVGDRIATMMIYVSLGNDDGWQCLQDKNYVLPFLAFRR